MIKGQGLQGDDAGSGLTGGRGLVQGQGWGEG